MARVLLTTSSWNSALTCVESLQAKGHQVDVLTELRSTPLNFSRRLNQCVYAPVEGENENAWTAHLIQVLETTRYDLLIPISDLAVNMVSRARDKIEPLVQVVMPSAQSVEIASDKAKSTRMAMKLGVPVPDSRFPETDSEMLAAFEELGLPAVVKVPISTGAEGVLISSDPQELVDFAQTHADPDNSPFCQRYFGGNLVGLATLAFQGELVASHCFEVEPQYLVGGDPPYAQEYADPKLIDYAKAIVKELNWSGPLDFDFLRAEDGSCVFLETNPRFSGTISFARAAGIDMPCMLLDLAEGRSVEFDAPPVSGREYRAGLQHELLWWSQDPKRRTGTLLSYRRQKDILSTPRLTDPGLLAAQLLKAGRKWWYS